MASTNSIPKTLGEFEILRELGRGGMGLVYEARQKSLNRHVALKVLASSLGLTPRAVKRFRREAEAAAKLHHTNIVPIYFTGEDSGVYYYAMELIDGPSLDQVIRHMRAGGAFETSQHTPEESDDTSSEPLPDWVAETIAYEQPQEASPTAASVEPSSTTTGSSVASGSKYFDRVATMIADVADALQHAHDHGVISRDIKPSNLLLGSDGRLSVSDFGLARVLEQPGMTMTGEFVGTPRYMSPEQISAGRAPLDHRTDIYSLGATLYELLTLKPAFTGHTRDEVIGKILHKEPRAPRSVNRRIPKDMETICLKAMERDPDRRYQHAGEMAADLRAFVNRFAISAKRVGFAGRTARLVRRNPVVSILTTLLAVACVVLFVGWKLHQGGELERAKRETLRAAFYGETQQAQKHLSTAADLGADSGWQLMMQGQIDFVDGRFEESIKSLEESNRVLPGNTAAYGLLTVAHFMAGDEDRYFECLQTLQSLAPEDDIDYLMMGWAQTWSNPRVALDNLKKVRDPDLTGPVATFLEAGALRELSMVEPTLSRAEKRLAEATAIGQVMCTLHPDNALAITDHLLSKIFLARLHASMKIDDEDPVMAALLPEIERLDAFPDHGHARFVRAIYAWQANRPEMAFQDWENDKVAGREPNNFQALTCAALFWKDGDHASAIEVLDKMSGKTRASSQYTRVYVALDEMDNRGRKAMLDVFAHVQPLRIRYGSNAHLIFDWTALKLLQAPGEKDAKYDELIEEVATEYRKWNEKTQHRDIWVPIAKYMQHPYQPETLLEQVAKNRMATAYAHYVIAIHQLSEGRRGEAEKHFGLCKQSDCIFMLCALWSDVFLEKMKGSDWLPWLDPGVSDNSIEHSVHTRE